MEGPVVELLEPRVVTAALISDVLPVPVFANRTPETGGDYVGDERLGLSIARDEDFAVPRLVRVEELVRFTPPTLARSHQPGWREKYRFSSSSQKV